jgi:iron complex outermembrane receptor protein
MLPSKLLGCFVSISCFGFQAAGQATDSLAKPVQNLPPVEVRGLRAGSNAPFAKTEISGKEIEKGNLGQDLPYLLQFTPSAVVTSDAGAGIGYSGLRIRGTDGSRINVTLNGIPVNDAESQGAFFVDLPDLASSVGSIQVQRGVGTSTNGAGAFGASMSVSALSQMERAGAEASLSGGSFNTQKYTVKAGTGLLRHGWQFDLRLSKLSSDGYIERSASDLKSLQFIAGWNINQKTSLKFTLLTGKEKTGQAWNGVPQDSLATNRRFNELGLKSDGSYYNNQTDNYQQDYYQLFLNHKFNGHLTANLGLFLTRGLGYYEEYRMGQSFESYGLPAFVSPSGADTLLSTDLIRQLWLDNYYYGAVFSFLYEKNNTKLSLGGGYNEYQGNHYGYIKWAQYGVPADYRWYKLDSRKTDANLYVKAEQRFGRFILFGDLQYRNINYFIHGFRNNPDLRPSVTYNFFNPKAGLSYLIANTSLQKQRLYASFAIANKEPNRDDFEAAATELPSAERLYDFEAGYEISRVKWSAGVNGYYMKYKDQLVPTGKINDVGAYTRTNVPDSYREGIELMAAFKPAYWVSLQGNVTFSSNKITDFTEYVDNYDEGGQDTINHGTKDLAFSPNQVASVLVSFTPFHKGSVAGGLSLHLMNKYVGRQYLDNTSNSLRSIDAYDLTDVRLRFALPVKPFREFAATLAINNIFDKQYESNGYTFSYVYGQEFITQNYYFPQAGINFLAGITLKW